MKKRPQPLLPKLYGALHDLSLMRDEVRGLADELAQLDKVRFLSHFDHIEAQALRLVEHFESRQRVVTH
jgi:hypothetical protein